MVGLVAWGLWTWWLPDWRPQLHDDERFGIDVSHHLDANLWLQERVFAAGVIVSVDDGWLSGLEVYHVEEEPVREFPCADRLEVIQRHGDDRL